MKAGQFACVISVCVGASCGDAIVGSDPCDNGRGQCSAQPLRSDIQPASDIAKIPVGDDLVEVSPTWVKDLPMPPLDPEVVGPQLDFARLVHDVEGHPWLFAVDLTANGVRVSRLDSAGKPLQSTLLEPPDGALGPQDGPVMSGRKILPIMRPVFSSHLFPTARIDWRRPCPNPSSGPGGTCWLTEQVFFQHGLDQPPLRTAIDWSRSDTFLDENGDQYYVTTSASPDMLAVKKVAGDAVLWTQTGFGIDRFTGLEAHGVALDAGRIVVSVAGRGDSGSVGFLLPYVLDSATGSVTELTGPDESVETYPHMLLTAGSKPIFVTTDLEGDLAVRWLESTPHALRGVEFQRLGYEELFAGPVDTAPDGTVYVLTKSGERGALHQTLCRAAENGAGGCVGLPMLLPDSTERIFIEEIVAQADGVVFARSQAHLLRIQFLQ